MTPTWKSLITFLSDLTRKKCPNRIQCTHCGNQAHYTKWGSYSRYLFNDELIHIQRYRCDNDQCHRKTFSILPHAFLPVLRASVCMLMYILMMHEQGHCIAEIAKKTGNTWSRIQRWISKAISIRHWFEKEYGMSCPCFTRIGDWFSFARNFSWTFYPARCR